MPIHRLSNRRTSMGALGALAALALLTCTGVAAQPAADWPTKTVRLVVGFPAGSSPDLTARLLAEPLSKALGQSVIVDNKVGAGGNIAADYVAKSTDGHTLGLMINGNMTIAGLLNPKLPYDPQKDLAPVSLIGTAPLVLAVPADAPGADAAQWLAQMRQSGAAASYGSPGVGTVAHLGMELLKARTGIAPVHVPYPGNPQVITAILGAQIQAALLPPALAAAQARSGKLRVLGSTSAGRSALAPDVPSLAEAGVKNYRLEIWNAVATPATQPAAQVQRLSAVVAEIVRSADIRAKLVQQGWQPIGSGPEELRSRIAADTQDLGQIIREQKIQP